MRGQDEWRQSARRRACQETLNGSEETDDGRRVSVLRTGVACRSEGQRERFQAVVRRCSDVVERLPENYKE